MILTILLILSIILLSCSAAEETSITVYNKYSDAETTQDLERSIDQNKMDIENNNITLKESNEDKCGYLFKYKDKEKFIEGAMTDIDLLLEMEQFFDLRIISKE